MGAGVPTAKDMTKEIVALIDRTPNPAPLHYIVATMGAAQTLDGGGAFDPVDVEQVFTAVEALAGRRTHELNPFVEWNPAVEGFDKPRQNALGARQLAQSLVDLAGQQRRPGAPSQAPQLQRLLERTIHSLANSSRGQGLVYRDIMNKMQTALCTVADVTDVSRVEYLSPLVEHGRREAPLTIATLNYDTTIELLAKHREVPCTTGIEEWGSTGTFPPPPDGIHLLKLHGSINWRVVPQPSDGIPKLADSTIKVVERPSEPGTPALVFGTRGKLRASGPFLDLLAQFRSALEGADNLVVVGYSFRDDHINQTLRKWVVGSSNRTLTVVDPASPPPRRPGVVDPFQTGFFEALLAVKRLRHIQEAASADALTRALEPWSGAM
jgi:hypothetical protein